MGIKKSPTAEPSQAGLNQTGSAENWGYRPCVSSECPENGLEGPAWEIGRG